MFDDATSDIFQNLAKGLLVIRVPSSVTKFNIARILSRSSEQWK